MYSKCFLQSDNSIHVVLNCVCRSNNGKSGATFSSSSQRQRLISEVSECGEDHCPVCLNRCRIFAVGLCNHHVCSECSTRMRVLCGQNECPICRQDMPKVCICVIFNALGVKFENDPLSTNRLSILLSVRNLRTYTTTCLTWIGGRGPASKLRR